MNLGTPATKWIAVACASLALVSIATVAGQSAAPAARPAAQAPSTARAAAVPPAPRTAESATATVAKQRALRDPYCVSCHNDRVKTANLSLEGLDLAAVDAHAEVWEKVVRKLRAGVMPPPDVKRPSAAEYNGLRDWLEAEIDRKAAAKINPGTVVLHRLNRTEYANAVRRLDRKSTRLNSSHLV